MPSITVYAHSTGEKAVYDVPASHGVATSANVVTTMTVPQLHAVVNLVGTAYLYDLVEAMRRGECVDVGDLLCSAILHMETCQAHEGGYTAVDKCTPSRIVHRPHDERSVVVHGLEGLPVVRAKLARRETVTYAIRLVDGEVWCRYEEGATTMIKPLPRPDVIVDMPVSSQVFSTIHKAVWYGILLRSLLAPRDDLVQGRNISSTKRGLGELLLICATYSRGVYASDPTRAIMLLE